MKICEKCGIEKENNFGNYCNECGGRLIEKELTMTDLMKVITVLQEKVELLERKSVVVVHEQKSFVKAVKNLPPHSSITYDEKQKVALTPKSDSEGNKLKDERTKKVLSHLLKSKKGISIPGIKEVLNFKYEYNVSGFMSRLLKEGKIVLVRRGVGKHRILYYHPNNKRLYESTGKKIVTFNKESVEGHVADTMIRRKPNITGSPYTEFLSKRIAEICKTGIRSRDAFKMAKEEWNAQKKIDNAYPSAERTKGCPTFPIIYIDRKKNDLLKDVLRNVCHETKRMGLQDAQAIGIASTEREWHEAIDLIFPHLLKIATYFGVSGKFVVERVDTASYIVFKGE